MARGLWKILPKRKLYPGEMHPEMVEPASAEWIVATVRKHGGSLTMQKWLRLVPQLLTAEWMEAMTKMNYGKRFSGCGEGAGEVIRGVKFGTPTGDTKKEEARRRAIATLEAKSPVPDSPEGRWLAKMKSER